MTRFCADLHIHTLLSPCGDLDMSPANIIRQAQLRKLDIIAITDHNSTRQAPLIRQMAKEKGIMVICGAEVTTVEEVHCICLIPDPLLDEFQKFLDCHLPDIKNNPHQFGYQVCVDEHENIVFEEDRLLIAALDQPIEQVEHKVHELGGIFIPAHINRPMNGIISQLGFLPPDLEIDALELSKHTSVEQFLVQYPYLSPYPFIQSSDAHYVEQIGTATTCLTMDKLSFESLKKAIKQINLES